MSTAITPQNIPPDVDYPTSDGKPMAETPIHRQNLTALIEMLEVWYAGREDVYISGNMMMYYELGNKRRHISPDVFVVIGVDAAKQRDAYLTWSEPKPTLDLVVEFTSPSTAGEDLEDKRELYRTVLGVREYLLFDPKTDYLDPPQQLFRLEKKRYRAVQPINGRLPSEVLGLHFERVGEFLRLYDPRTNQWIPLQADLTERERVRADKEAERADKEQELRLQGDQEIARLRAELEASRRHDEL